MDMEKAQSLTSITSDGENVPYVHISRPAVTQEKFDEMHAYQENSKSFKKHLGEYMRSKCECSRAFFRRQVLSWFPFIALILGYRKSYIVGDIISGLSVGVVHVPQAMGFALLTAVKPVYGLYSSFFQNIVYFLFGTSHHVSVGTMALISLMVGAVVERELPYYVSTNSTDSNMTTNPNVTDNAEEKARIGIAASVTLLAGLFQIGMGLFNLGGFIIRYMSAPFVGGFTTGAACQIVTSQLAFIFGIKLPRHTGAFQLPKTYISLFENIAITNVASLVISIISIFFLVILKEVINEKVKSKLKVPIPAELLLVMAGTLISYFVQLDKVYGVKIVGEIRRGFPAPEIPNLALANNYTVDALLIALVSFALSISMVKLYSTKYDYSVDTNQEVFAYGMLHFLSSFFHCFAGAVAPPRCVIHDSTGGKTQVASLISCVLLLIVILFIGPYFASLPNCILASIIVVALLPLFKQFKNLKMLWRVNFWDCAVWVVTWLAVVILDVVLGLVVGIGFSLLTTLIQSQLSRTHIVQATNSTDLFTRSRHIKANDFSHIRIFKYQGMLYFTNSEGFVEKISCEIDEINEMALPPVEKDGQVFSVTDNDGTENVSSTEINVTKQTVNHCNPHDGMENQNHTSEKVREADDMKANIQFTIILDCAGLTYIDLVGLNAVKRVGKMCKNANISLLFVNCDNSLYIKLQASGFLDEANRNTVFPSLQDAMAFALSRTSLSASTDTVITRM